MTWHIELNRLFWEHYAPEQKPYNNTNDPNISIIKPELDGRIYDIIGIHKWVADGGQYVYLDLLDENDQRIRWGRIQWRHNRTGGVWSQSIIDKPDTEPGANAPIYPNWENMQIRVKGSFPSSTIQGISSHNKWSYYILFKRVLVEDIIEPPKLTITAKEITNVYSGPSNDYDIIGILAKEANREAIGLSEQKDYFVIIWEGQDKVQNGYVYYSDVESNIDGFEDVEIIPDPSPIIGKLEVRLKKAGLETVIVSNSLITSKKSSDSWVAVFLEKEKIRQLLNNNTEWVNIFIEAIPKGEWLISMGYEKVAERVQDGMQIGVYRREDGDMIEVKEGLIL